MFEAYFDLPDGYQVQLMVLRDFPGGQPKRGLRMNIFRSRVWIGHQSEPESLLYRSQEHQDLRVAIDACYSTALNTARSVIESLEAVSVLEAEAHSYFAGNSKAV